MAEPGKDPLKRYESKKEDLVDVSGRCGTGRTPGGNTLEEDNEEDEEEVKPSMSQIKVHGDPRTLREKGPSPEPEDPFLAWSPFKCSTPTPTRMTIIATRTWIPWWPLLSTSGEAGGEVGAVSCGMGGRQGPGSQHCWHGAWTDMGLEKVGMYIKTVTDGNVVHQDSRIQVNDLLMEMDGMNLVGVTQSFVASML